MDRSQGSGRACARQVTHARLRLRGWRPYAAFLPPAVVADAGGKAPFHRAVAIVTEYSIKGTERSGQEYARNPEAFQ